VSAAEQPPRPRIHVYNLPPVVTAGALQALPGATHAPHPFCHHRAYDRNGSALVQAGVYQVTSPVPFPSSRLG
jgi:hypothetical protein